MVFGAHLLSCKLRIEGPVFGEDKWSGVGMVRQWADLQGQALCHTVVFSLGSLRPW